MITPLYAAPLALLLLILSGRVIVYRRKHQLGLGDHGDKSLTKRMRAQANCAEYVPIGVLLMLLVEVQDAPTLWLHAIGLTLLIGRLLHGYGFSASPPNMNMRVAGMMLTLLSIALSSVTAFVLALS